MSQSMQEFLDATREKLERGLAAVLAQCQVHSHALLAASLRRHQLAGTPAASGAIALPAPRSAAEHHELEEASDVYFYGGLRRQVQQKLRMPEEMQVRPLACTGRCACLLRQS
jgi:hypothetical protein